MTLDEILTLFDYDVWVSEEISCAVSGLVDDQYIRDLGASFGSIRGTLLHVYGADRVWLARWMGNSPSVPWPVSGIETPSQLEEYSAVLKIETLKFSEYVD